MRVVTMFPSGPASKSHACRGEREFGCLGAPLKGMFLVMTSKGE